MLIAIVLVSVSGGTSLYIVEVFLPQGQMVAINANIVDKMLISIIKTPF